MMTQEFYLGLMSGTSMDGLDVVLVDFSGSAPELIAHSHTPIPAPLAQRLHRLCQPATNEIHQLAEADQLFAEFCATAVQQLLTICAVEPTRIRAIGSHGQTIRHHPEGHPAYTIQLGDPNTLAVQTGIPVVADFRRKDMALGGQGAPLVPAFHHAMFRLPEVPRVIVNLGGIANITWLPGSSEQVLGFDTGPANTLLDQWYRHCHPKAAESYDRDGQFAAQGQVHESLLAQWLAFDYFRQPPPKSTGRDDFNLAWLHQLSGDLNAYAPADIQATLVELTARTVIDAMQRWLPHPPHEVFVAGGGVANPVLQATFKRLAPALGWHSTDTLGVDPQHVEAMAFAWLARCFMTRQPGNLPAVTGASRPAILGGLYLP